jgi:uroporphyrinogen-III synthase
MEFALIVRAILSVRYPYLRLAMQRRVKPWPMDLVMFLQHAVMCLILLLHVAVTKTAGDLAGNLLGAGFKYRREILYNVVAAQFLHSNTIMALIKKELQGVLLYSPRTAQIFCRCTVADLGENMLSGVTAYCLSEAVADKAKVLKWRAVVVASSPTQLELIHVVARGV